jgi:hypothetical protein
MKTNNNSRLDRRFAPDGMFDVPTANVRLADYGKRFEKLQQELVDHLFQDPMNNLLRQELERVANDAAAVAWATPFPLLFFPVVLNEKVDAQRFQDERQNRIEKQSRVLFESALADSEV